MMTTTDFLIRLNDLNAAIADLERQQADNPDCIIVQDALAAYQKKVKQTERELRRAKRQANAAA